MLFGKQKIAAKKRFPNTRICYSLSEYGFLGLCDHRMHDAMKKNSKIAKTLGAVMTFRREDSFLPKAVRHEAVRRWLNRPDLKDMVGRADFEIADEELIDTLESLIDEAAQFLNPKEIISNIEKRNFKEFLAQRYALVALSSILLPFLTREELQQAISKFREQQMKDKQHLISTGYSTYIPKNSFWLHSLFGHLLQVRHPIFTRKTVTKVKSTVIRYIWDTPQRQLEFTDAVLSGDERYTAFINGYGVTKDCCLEIAPGRKVEPLPHNEAPFVEGLGFQKLFQLEQLREPMYQIRQKVLAEAEQALLTGTTSIIESVLAEIKKRLSTKDIALLLQHDRFWHTWDPESRIHLEPLLYNETDTPGSITHVLAFAYLVEHELKTAMLAGIKEEFPSELTDSAYRQPHIKYRSVWEIPVESPFLDKLLEIRGRVYSFTADWRQWYEERIVALLDAKISCEAKLKKVVGDEKRSQVDFEHNATFRSVRTKRQTFKLTPMEADVTKFLYERWQQGQTEQSLEDIFIHLNKKYYKRNKRSENRSRFRDVFRNTEARKALFVSSKRGFWRMNLP